MTPVAKYTYQPRRATDIPRVVKVFDVTIEPRWIERVFAAKAGSNVQQPKYGCACLSGGSQPSYMWSLSQTES